MNHPIIGSDPRCTDSRYWRFERTSGLPRDAFDQHDRGDYWVLVFCVGVLAGLIAVVLAEWLS
jgi:hypothetical protein